MVVTVLDGDTGRRVHGALVRIGRLADRANPKGNAELGLRRLAPLVVSVRARGYGDLELRLPFQRKRRVVVRVYHENLQWPMYGATPARTQAHLAIRVRPPFRVVWSRGLGSLIEFPAVVSDGVAYIGNIHGTVRAISMRNGRVLWRRDIRHGKMAASPAVVGDDLVVHGMDGVVRVLDRRTGRRRFAFHVGSPIESSPLVRDRIDYFGAWNGNVYALDLRTRRLRWVYGSGWKITSSAAIADRTLYIGNYGGRLLALAPGSGRLRWSAGVNGRIYGTPAVWAGRVFVPSSDGGSLTAFTTRGRYLWASTRAATSTPHRPSGAVTSTSAPTTDGCTAPRRAPGASAGRCRRAGRSRARRRSSTALPTPAASPTASSASTPTPAARCSAFRTASTCPSPGAAAGCSCTATRVCTRWSHRNPGRNHSFE